MTIGQIQADFNQAFPFLKLEFFIRKNIPKRTLSLRDRVDPGIRIGGNAVLEEKSALEVNSGMKVSELERKFFELFGLSAQVYRKSGRAWIETTLTDDWSLEMQNTEGRELSDMPRRSLQQELDNQDGPEVE